MICQVLIRGIDVWFIPAGMGNPGLEIIRYNNLRDAMEKFKSMDMGIYPGRQVLSHTGLCEGITAGPEGGQKNLCISDLTSSGVYYGDGVACIIHKQFFSGPVFLPEGQVQFFHPFAVKMAELAVLISMRVCLLVLIPEELKRNAFFLQFLVEVLHVRGLAFGVHPLSLDREKQMLKGRIIQFRIKWPGKVCQFCPEQVIRHGRVGNRTAFGNLPVGQVAVPF